MRPVIRVAVSVAGKSDKVLAAYSHRLATHLELAGRDCGVYLLGESNRLVPQDTTALWQSGHWRLEGEGLYLVVVVGYGSQGDHYREVTGRDGRVVDRHPHDYAVFVHENIAMPHPHRGQARFLAEAVMTSLSDLQEIIWRRVGVK